jgi:hypothetical protein
VTSISLPSRPELASVPVIGGAVAYLAALSWAMQRTSYDIWGGLIVLPVLLAVTLPLVTRQARRQGDIRLVRILQLAVLAKVVAGTVVRYGVYGTGDAQGYHGAGRTIAASLRSGSLAFDAGGGGEGTQAINVLTGVVYAVIGPTKLGGFFVFSWMAFLGLYLFFLAYRRALPQGDHHRYALLLFFLPTVLFWPSSLGKEAAMMLTLGVAVYGATLVLSPGRRGGFLILALGLATTALVRPHLSVLVFLALAGGYLLRRSPGPQGRVLTGAKVLGMAVLLLLGVLVAGRFQDFFNLDELDTDSVNALIENTADKSTGGESDFAAVSAAQQPWTLPQAALAVLFRPFPFEANNAQALATSLEGMALLVLFVWSARRVVASLRSALLSPYIAFVVIYSLLYVVAFSTISNFGILARQRSLVYPLVLVLLTLPAIHRDLRRRDRPTGAPLHP